MTVILDGFWALLYSYNISEFPGASEGLFQIYGCITPAEFYPFIFAFRANALVIQVPKQVNYPVQFFSAV